MEYTCISCGWPVDETEMDTDERLCFECMEADNEEVINHNQEREK